MEEVYKRKMASIRRVDEVGPIPDADAIEVATVGGWKVVQCIVRLTHGFLIRLHRF